MPARKSNKKQKKINLLPREDFDKTTLGRVLKWSLTTFRYIVIMVELVVVGGFLSRFYFDVQISDLNDEIVAQSAIIDAREDFENDFRNAQLKLSILSTINDDSNSSLPILDKISEYIPLDVTLTQIDRKDDLVTVTAITASDSSMNLFSALMSQDSIFDNVQITSISQIEDSLIFEFELKADVNFANVNI